MKKYQIIYADPPWDYKDKMTEKAFGASFHYKTQGIEWIKNLKIQEIADNNCVLFLWAVSPQLPEALDVIKSWGFKYKTVAFVWSKRYPSGEYVSNLGRWTMGNVEICLLATKGKINRVCKNVKQLVVDTRTVHSKKPDQVRNRIVELMGDLPRIELFARNDGSKDLFNKNPLDGWDAWGNEVNSDIDLSTN